MKTHHSGNRKRQLVYALALCLVSGSVAAEQESLPGSENMAVSPEHLTMLAQMCEQCHGPAGASTRDDVPGLAGRPADELMAEIERFYFYERHCPEVPLHDSISAQGEMSMCDVTSQMNKAEAMALARYFSSGQLPPMAPAQ